MNTRVSFAKDRQKFSAAHFTLFSDGQVERLHGHNYMVAVTLHGDVLTDGLLFPFHEVKPIITELCGAWDERVMLPAKARWVHIEEKGEQCQVRLTTPKVDKFYSFPLDDVVILPCDNISSENLAALFAEMLVNRLAKVVDHLTKLEVSIAETTGQSVTVTAVL